MRPIQSSCSCASHRWDELLKLPPPNPSLSRVLAFRTRVCLCRNGPNRDGGSRATNSGNCSQGNPRRLRVQHVFQQGRTFLDLAENILDARIAAAKGDHEQAIKYWEKAVDVEDQLYYGEPPEWFYPVRESLGAALLLNGQADRAEAVFRADLEQYPRNPRSLFGLLKSLEAQKKSSNVEEVRGEFEAAWKNADTTLSLRDQ